MQSLIFILFLQAGAVNAETYSQTACPRVHPAKTVERLSQLEPDIRNDLLSIYRDMGERGSHLQLYDSPGRATAGYKTSRFDQAVLIKNVWYVQFEVANLGRRTLGYTVGADGHFSRSPIHYYGGPFCETLEAASKGVISAGSLNF
jgi:hypothetical protein